MPFEPLTPDERKQFPEPCRDPDHDPPAHVVITEMCKWVCPTCGDAVVLCPPTVRFTPALGQVVSVGYEARTRDAVRRERRTVVGCCNRHADNMRCDCMVTAAPCPECGDSGWAVHPENGRNLNARRCSRGCPSNCSICSNPNCDNPNGQH